MRWINWSFAVAGIAIVGLGVAAWMARQERAKLAQENVSLQQNRSALDTSVRQAQEQTTALNDAVKGSQQYERDQRRGALRKQDLASGLAAAAGMRTAMTEYYMSQGKWPASNETLG